MVIDHIEFTSGYLSVLKEKMGVEKLQFGLGARIENDCMEFIKENHEQLEALFYLLDESHTLGRAFAKVRMDISEHPFQDILHQHAGEFKEETDILEKSANSWTPENLRIENGKVTSDDLYQAPQRPTLEDSTDTEFEQILGNIELEPLNENEAGKLDAEIQVGPDDVTEHAYDDRLRLEVLILQDNAGAISHDQRQEMNKLAEILCEKLAGKDPQEFLQEVRQKTLAEQDELTQELESKKLDDPGHHNSLEG